MCQQLIVDISMHTLSWQQGRHIVFLANAQYFQRQSSFSNTLSTLLTGLWATGLIFPLDFETVVFFHLFPRICDKMSLKIRKGQLEAIH